MSKIAKDKETNAKEDSQQRLWTKLIRARFVYEAARLEAQISSRPIIPEAWEDRSLAFQDQFIAVVDDQCSGRGFQSAEAAHNSWVRAYQEMEWKYGPCRDTEKRLHPDMVPFNELPKAERDKDEIFLRLCDVAKLIGE